MILDEIKRKLGKDIVIDIKDVYKSAICFEHCHALPMNAFEKKIGTFSLNLRYSSVIDSIFEGAPYIYGEQRIRGDKTSFLAKGQKDSELMSLVDGDVHPIERLGLPLGEWLIIGGEAKTAQTSFSLKVTNKEEDHLIYFVNFLELVDEIALRGCPFKRNKYLLLLNSYKCDSVREYFIYIENVGESNEIKMPNFTFPDSALYGQDGLEYGWGLLCEEIDDLYNCEVFRRKDIVTLKKELEDYIAQLVLKLRDSAASFVV